MLMLTRVNERPGIGFHLSSFYSPVSDWKKKQKKDFGVNIDGLAIATQGARIGLYA